MSEQPTTDHVDNVTMRGVDKRFGKHQVLSRVSFSARGGSILGLIGANGAGKTTLLRLLLGLVRAASVSTACRRRLRCDNALWPISPEGPACRLPLGSVTGLVSSILVVL